MVAFSANHVSDDGIKSILKELAKPASHRGWISDEFVRRVTLDVAAAAGLPASASEGRDALEKALSAADPQRTMMIVVGRQNAGKTTLMWRLREPAAERMEDFKSTNGLIIGA